MFGSTVMSVFNRSSQGDVAAVESIFNSNDNQNIMNESVAGGVMTQDLSIGSGPEIRSGMAVSVHYVLKLSDGTLIQDSKVVGGGEPFTFLYGAGQLIPGWEMGIEGMKVGGKRLITIPPALGYGSQAVGPIPAESTLFFEIEVVSAE